MTVAQFGLLGGEVVQGRVPAAAVVPLDEGEGVGAGLLWSPRWSSRSRSTDKSEGMTPRSGSIGVRVRMLREHLRHHGSPEGRSA